MRAGVLAVAAAFASGVSAGKHHAARRHAHEAFHVERGLLLTTGASSEPTCGCTTIYTTITGEGTIYNAPTSYSSMAPSPSTTAPVYVPTSSGPPTVPTPLATTCPTPGVYTIPAVTITVTEETTVCAETSTTLPASGTYTVGGVTTVVVEETTVVCPYATISTSGTVVTEIIETTTYVCPSAGTYTIAPLTTVCETETVWVYPTVASYPPGTYTQNEVITTITETDYVVFCPFTSGAPVATPAPAPPVSTTPASTPNTGSLGTSGNQWAITYSPYENNGACKDAGSVASDIAEIAAKGFTSVRIYSTDCSGLENVGTACANEGLKLILGIFISTTGCSGAQQQVTDIITWGQWDLVELIVIGNEAVFSEYASASELASFISSCKSAFSGAGYTGPCTTTEPLNIWQENIDVFCEVVDVVGCNIHPFFNSDVTADQAGDFVASQLAIVDALCTGKYGVNLETGWPSAGTCNGVACPSPDNQATAVALISEAAGGKSVMFSFVNDYWKDPGAFGCEQSWGSIQLFGN